MRLQRRATATGDSARWVLHTADGPVVFRPQVGLADLMLPGALDRLATAAERADPARLGRLLAPVDVRTEVWAAGVTYERSRQARIAESETPDIYERVYAAERPELFFKSVGWRVSGPDEVIAIRADSQWDVPEPELVAVLDPSGSVFGWTIGNDVSSRSIEAANPLYLPQAKVYLGACALGPEIVLTAALENPYDLAITLVIERAGQSVWQGTASTGQLRRRVAELSAALFRADVFPEGVLLSTGTCLVPDEEFSLAHGDVVRIAIGGLGELRNRTVRGMVPDAASRIGRLRGAAQ